VSPFEAKRNADLETNSTQIPPKNAQHAFVRNQGRILLLVGTYFATIGFLKSRNYLLDLYLILTGTKSPGGRSRLALPLADKTKEVRTCAQSRRFRWTSRRKRGRRKRGRRKRDGIGFKVFVPFHSSESE